MAKKYFFSLDANGKPANGTIMNIPDEYTHEADENVWLNQDRAFFENGAWTVYEPIVISVPEIAEVDATVSVSATLPVGSPDTDVSFVVSYTDENGEQTMEPIVVTAVDSVASHDFAFAVAGTYQISASSTHHGSDSGEVAINEPAPA